MISLTFQSYRTQAQKIAFLSFHFRFEETNEASTSCQSGEKCIGGYARAVTVIKDLMNDKRRDSNPIFLNAGDNFQGTLWYSLGRWNVTAHFLNLLKADAMVRLYLPSRHNKLKNCHANRH